MYLVLRPPWGSATTANAPIDAAVAASPPDAGAKAKPKRSRPNNRVAHGSDDTADEPVVLTAADRALETRGDDVALPAQRIDMAGGSEARPLDDGEISATLSSQSGAVRDCVVQAATGTELSATITIQMVVDGGGRVIKTRIEAPHYLFGQGLYACASRALRALRFPATGAPTRVSFPVHLG